MSNSDQAFLNYQTCCEKPSIMVFQLEGTFDMPYELNYAKDLQAF